MGESIENQINRAIRNHKRGKIFFPSSFKKYGSSTAVRQALNRLEDKGLILRIAQGIYLYPQKHEVLGILYPSVDQIAIAIAKRDKARIIPTGLNALNKLGLSTQVPMNLVYLTDGTPRKVTVGKRKIKFKVASPKLLSARNETCLLVIQALREIGSEKIDNVTIKKINSILKNVPDDELLHDANLAPVWIADIIKHIINYP